MNNYLIYIGSGGLCHCLSGLSKAINLAIETKRILVIDTMKLKSIENKLSYFFDIKINDLTIQDNYKEIINKRVFGMDMRDFKKIYPKLVDNYYYIGKNNVTDVKKLDCEDKIIVYCGYGGPYINPKIKLNLFFKNKIKDNLKNYKNINYISIQFRNTDKKNDCNLFIQKINQHINKLKRNNINKIFLATDDYNSFNIFKNLLTNFKIFKISNIENHNGKCLHYNVKDKYKLNIDLLQDIYMILNSKYFIPSINSGVSRWIIQMIESKRNIFDIKSKTQIWMIN